MRPDWGAFIPQDFADARPYKVAAYLGCAPNCRRAAETAKMARARGRGAPKSRVLSRNWPRRGPLTPAPEGAQSAGWVSSDSLQRLPPAALSSGSLQQLSPAILFSGSLQRLSPATLSSGYFQRLPPAAFSSDYLQRLSPAALSSGSLQWLSPQRRFAAALSSGYFPAILSSGSLQRLSPATLSSGSLQQLFPAALSSGSLRSGSLHVPQGGAGSCHRKIRWNFHCGAQWPR